MNLSFRIALLAAVLAAPALNAQQPATPAKPPAPEGIAHDTKKEDEGKLAATGWIGLLDRRDWGTAWERSSAVFRKNVPLGNWMDNIPKVRESFGAFQQREVVGVVYKTTMPGQPNGDYVTVSFASKFDRKVDVKELVVTVREPDGRWRVTGYSAQ
ncbi:MAG: DUF4019 domain-containing protein [Burkholderiales bacterium]|nr:DUF4019 domain-containing protein [Burkholderiales bacterium]